MAIVLKNLCQEYDIDPYDLRMALRAKLKKPKNERWQWSEDDPQLTQARAIALSLKGKSSFDSYVKRTLKCG